MKYLITGLVLNHFSGIVKTVFCSDTKNFGLCRPKEFVVKNSFGLRLRRSSGVPPHINIVGYPGSKKSSVARSLAKRYGPAIWISRPNTRPQRMGEVYGQEYLFLTKKEYAELEVAGKLWHTKTRIQGGVEFRKGTFVPKFWPEPTPETKLVISMFGPTRSAQIAREFAPNMTTVCLFGTDLVLLEKILERNAVDAGLHHRETIRRYREARIEEKFEHKMNTDRRTAEECADWIAGILGLDQAIAA